MSSCHPLFDVTGTFNNPGPLGGYLVVGLVVAVLLYAFSFEKEYMFYQADYFRNHPQSDFLNVADNVTYPYNELLHIAVETGMCGLVLFLLVVSPFVFSDERTLKAVLAAWLIFAMFSYPVNVVPLMMNFALFTGLCRGKTVSVLGVNRIFCGIAVVPLMGLLAVCGHVMLFFCESSTLLIDVLGRKVRNVEQVDLLQKLPLSCETYCMRGDIYLERKSYGQAEESYKVAAEMIPTRIRPNYKLWNLYLLQQDTVNARKMALHILAQRVKVENTFSIKVRGRMKQFLDEID